MHFTFVTFKLITFVTMDLIDRFRYVMKVYNETPSSFADKIGVQRSSISHILSGRNKPSLDFIQKIMEHYPKIDAQWLINGKQSNPKEVEVRSESEKEIVEESIQESTTSNIEKEESNKLESKEQEDNGEIVKAESIKPSLKGKQIDKIIVFYTDNTFETFNQ